MNQKEFLEEVLTSDICPDDFEMRYARFQKYQEAALNTLREFHRLCENYGIRYQLAYGSLIGAVRDAGQIPWDYDIDVFIPYEDKEKLIFRLKNDLDPNFYAYCPEIDPLCKHTLMRISPVGYDSNAIHVDVFYVMALPDDEEGKKQILNNIAKLYHTRAVKKTNIISASRGSKKRMIKLLLEKIKYLFVSQKWAEEEYDRRCSMYKLEETECCAPATYDADKCVYYTKKLWDTEIVDLPIGSFRITKDYDQTLRQYYGNYMHILPLDVRLKEMLNSLERIDYYVALGN